MTELQRRLFELQDKKYQAFHSKLIPNIEPAHVIGIRTPVLRNFAKAFAKEDEFMHKEQRVVSAIHRLAKPDSVEIESGLALIAVVGRGMKSASGTAGKLFSALAKDGINIKMIDRTSDLC